ncbi:MAG: hypothetical protein KBD63_07630 [Bacteriovoracaceae bacterium]|nr:hypothetical protein [Bacteriovoracaceae bacterium]
MKRDNPLGHMIKYLFLLIFLNPATSFSDCFTEMLFKELDVVDRDIDVEIIFTYARNGEIEKLRSFLKTNGLKINIQDSKGNTALHIAVGAELDIDTQEDLGLKGRGVKRGDETILLLLQIMRENGFPEINQLNEKKETAFSLAVKLNYPFAFEAINKYRHDKRKVKRKFKSQKHSTH